MYNSKWKIFELKGQLWEKVNLEKEQKFYGKIESVGADFLGLSQDTL